MRARNIKPGFFSNDSLAELHPLTRILFVGLWLLADREGRLEDRPRRIKTEVLPYDEADVDGMLQELQSGGFIQRYQAGGERFIQVLKFSKHQNPHKNERPSAIPACPEFSTIKEVESNKSVENQAPDLHHTSTVQAPPAGFSEENQGSLAGDECQEVARLIPDSLIPDSNNDDWPPPDPSHAEALARMPIVATTRQGQIAMILRQLGFQAQSVQPNMLAWAKDERITDDLIKEAADIAKKQKPGERINSQYLVPIIAQLLRPPKAPGPTTQFPLWRVDDNQCVALGNSLGVTARAGETFDQFRARISAELSRIKEAA